MDERIRMYRHDLRGQLNSIMLCASVLPITNELHEKLQFVDEIILAADRGMAILDQIDALPPEAFIDTPGA